MRKFVICFVTLMMFISSETNAMMSRRDIAFTPRYGMIDKFQLTPETLESQQMRVCMRARACVHEDERKLTRQRDER